MQSNNRVIWYKLIERHRRPFSKYLRDQQSLNIALNDLADRLTTFLIESIRTKEQAVGFWKVVPFVLTKCDELETYTLPMAPEAYAWLHLLDRYVRTWKALEEMVNRKCLPLAINGINVLDVGTGPGPSILAITDFYSSLSRYAAVCGEPRLIQPTSITTVELSEENTAFRSRFREVSRVSSSESTTIPDITVLDIRAERANFRDELLNQQEYDPYTERFEFVSRLTLDEGSRVEKLHRYRLVTLTNFLTNEDVLDSVRDSLQGILRDLRPGSAVVLIGGIGGHYPEIYREFDGIAAEVGLRKKISNVELSSTDADTALIVQAARTVSEHIEKLSPISKDVPTEVTESLRRGRRWGGKSALRVYRRNRYKISLTERSESTEQ